MNRQISIHALREEGDFGITAFGSTTPYFYPRPPRGGRLPVLLQDHTTGKFLSTPSARRATFWKQAVEHRPVNFYPRPPRGGRLVKPGRKETRWKFLSTPSARRATSTKRLVACSRLFLSTPSARRATLATKTTWRDKDDFYPRPPRGGRLQLTRFTSVRQLFLSTPSARRATRLFFLDVDSAQHFYPRPPRGGRLEHLTPRSSISLFLSTPSARRATVRFNKRLRKKQISIHALREEGDIPSNAPRAVCLAHFYPRPPRGGRQQKQRQNLYFQTNYTTFCTNLEEP